MWQPIVLGTLCLFYNKQKKTVDTLFHIGFNFCFQLKMIGDQTSMFENPFCVILKCFPNLLFLRDLYFPSQLKANAKIIHVGMVGRALKVIIATTAHVCRGSPDKTVKVRNYQL